jgi:hypothetical protein
MGRVTIDVVTYDPKTDSHKMILVEEGPWETGAILDNLRALQERLYNCVDAVVDGHVAERFPDSKGKDVVIQLDCYDIPEDVAPFFERFANHIRSSAEVEADMKRQGFVRALRFECNRRTLKGQDA